MNSWLPELTDLFISQVSKSGDCLEWQGERDSKGYGRFRDYGSKIDEKTHRISFFLANGFWPEICRHTCDNPPCCDPEHLLDGTRADNTKDMITRGRHKPNKRKFSDEQEDIIRSEYLAGGSSYRKLAAKYKTSFGNIQWIMRRGEIN